MRSELTPWQTKVVEEAKKRLRASGVSQVCLDELPDERDEGDEGNEGFFETAVRRVVTDTLYWEGKGS